MNKVIDAAAGSILSLLLSTAVCAQDEHQYLFNGEHSIRLAADVEAPTVWCETSTAAL